MARIINAIAHILETYGKDFDGGDPFHYAEDWNAYGWTHAEKRCSVGEIASNQSRIVRLCQQLPDLFDLQRRYRYRSNC